MRRGYKPKQPQVFYRINHQIYAKELRVLGDDGKQIGILTREEALKKSTEMELDLVEVAPKAIPPVAKIIDYRKFLYQLKKKKQEEKKKTVKSETKQIWMKPFIDEHDLDIKVKKAREFIEDGDKVKFAVKFRGREMARQDIGREKLVKVVEKMQDIAKVEREAKMEGRQMVMVMSKGAVSTNSEHHNETKQV